jgi:hypothetical protein
MPRKPKDATRDFLEAVKRKSAERHGEVLTPRILCGRPRNNDSVSFYNLARRVAMYRDAGLPVRPRDRRTKNAVSKVIQDCRKEQRRFDDLMRNGCGKRGPGPLSNIRND